jgi:hypothetical protein
LIVLNIKCLFVIIAGSPPQWRLTKINGGAHFRYSDTIINMMQMNDSVDVQLIQTVESARQVLHPWLQEQQVGEAMGAHYALYANANQIKLLVAVQAQAERPLGYLVVAPTRLDLFHPLVVLRTNHGPVGELLLRAGLSLQQSYYVTMPAVLADQLACQWLPAEAELLRMYSLSRDDFSPVWHPLVRGGLAADGSPRFEVRLQEQNIVGGCRNQLAIAAFRRSLCADRAAGAWTRLWACRGYGIGYSYFKKWAHPAICG